MKRQEEIKKNFERAWENFKAFRQATIEKLENKRLKVNLLKEEFKRKEEDVRRDSEEATMISRKLSERFKWWGLLP